MSQRDSKTTIQPNDEQRRSRLALFRANDQMRIAIDMMPVTDQVKSELRVLSGATLRMALTLNDGHVSPVELQIW